MIATAVDDTLSAGTKGFQQDTLETARRFTAKPRTLGNLTFAGVVIIFYSAGTRTMHQALYAAKLDTLSQCFSYADFRSRKHKLGWITHTRPDVARDSAILTQVTQTTFAPVHVKRLNTAIRRFKNNPQLGLKVRNLNKEKLKIISYDDTSFVKFAEYRTQPGFAILLFDESKLVNWLTIAVLNVRR